jgi:hypothetical protein
LRSKTLSYIRYYLSTIIAYPVRNTLLCCLAACIVPLASQAQDSAPTAYRPFYVAGGANLGSYFLKWGGGYIREPFSFSPSLAVGIALKPKWGLQARVTAYEQRSSNNYTYSPSWVSSSGPRKGKTTYVTTTYRNRIIVAPLLFRYTLTQDATRRLQADALLGFTFIRTNVHSSGTTRDSVNTILSSSSDGVSALASPLTYGASLRYALTPRVELATELLANFRFIAYGAAQSANLQLELRYRFGPLKKS